MADAEGIVTISIAKWTESVALYIEGVGVTMREALYEEWPLLLRKVMDFTPPFKTQGAPGSSDLSVGRQAVNHDIRKTMRPFNPEAKTKQMEHILDTKDVRLFNLIAMRVKKGPMANARAVAFSSIVHTSQRNARGRVGAGTGNVVLGSDAGLLAKYIKHEQDNVGIAKAGWWPALALVGGDAPSYVTRHGMSFGAFVDDHANADNPSITAINRTPWAVRKDEGERILNSAYQSRAVQLRAKVMAKLRLAAKQARLD